jgi:hypothetical protein
MRLDPARGIPELVDEDVAAAYERLILRLLRDELLNDDSFGPAWRFQTVELEGSHPDTRIVISWFNESSRRNGRREYAIWDKEGVTEGQRESPHSFVGIVMATLFEG